MWTGVTSSRLLQRYKYFQSLWIKQNIEVIPGFTLDLLSHISRVDPYIPRSLNRSRLVQFAKERSLNGLLVTIRGSTVITFSNQESLCYEACFLISSLRSKMILLVFLWVMTGSICGNRLWVMYVLKFLWVQLVIFRKTLPIRGNRLGSTFFGRRICNIAIGKKSCEASNVYRGFW